jgi:TRAP transporter 4TM/12TM fusion protein
MRDRAMSVDTPAITYHEQHELGFLERLLLGRVHGAVKAVLLVCTIMAIALAILHLYVAAFGTPEGRSFRSVHLTVMLTLAIFMFPLFRQSIRDPIVVPRDPRNTLRIIGFGIDLVLVALVLFVEVYTIWDIDAFQLRLGDKYPPDLIVGGILIVIVLETTRRAVGWAMVLVTSFFIVHTLFSDHFYGIFFGPPVRFPKFIDSLFMASDGLFGIPLHVVATYIVLFIIFGAVLIRSGAGRFFIDLAVALTGHRIGGPAKAAVVASGFMGTVSGSAVANVVTTGSFTIPLMKNLGYRPKFAASVEACASSGGQIMPPIMGAAAFVMAEFLEVPYSSIIVAAAIPAFLYYVTIYFMVHLEADKHSIGAVDKKSLPRVGETLAGGWHLLIALLVLVYFLLVGYTPMKSAIWGLGTLFVLSFVNKGTRMSPVDLLAALEAGIRATVPVTIACACAGLIIGSVFVSGLGLKFTDSVIQISHGNLLVLLALTGVSAIVLGMGITTTAVYITVAALIVPALIKSGIVPIAAHMFAFYFGVVSAITPPVALASFAAAAIAKSPPMATAVESTRIGIAKYIVPLVFVYDPSLLFIGPLWATVISTALAMAGLWVLSIGLEGWYRGPLSILQRLVALAAAILILLPPLDYIAGLPGYVADTTGLVVAAFVLAPRIIKAMTGQMQRQGA